MEEHPQQMDLEDACAILKDTLSALGTPDITHIIPVFKYDKSSAIMIACYYDYDY
jgi:hypothetical protein